MDRETRELQLRPCRRLGSVVIRYDLWCITRLTAVLTWMGQYVIMRLCARTQ
jgi:hypothetical protein